ncbi:hypothetical protein [Rubritalea tangerina]|uniref:hypothetical protein n=1 Tax=Rubritalea tangerina TaxID=430798 RepID=UPI003619D278
MSQNPPAACSWPQASSSPAVSDARNKPIITFLPIPDGHHWPSFFLGTYTLFQNTILKFYLHFDGAR